MKKVDGYGHGDHYVTFKIIVPKKLNDKQKALMQAYAELETDTPGTIFGVTSKTDGKRTLLIRNINNKRFSPKFFVILNRCLCKKSALNIFFCITPLLLLCKRFNALFFCSRQQRGRYPIRWFRGKDKN